MIAGARILKTGLAVTLSMLICEFFNIQPAIFAGTATILGMQPSVAQSIFNAREQVLAHFTSIGLAILLGLTFGTHPLSMGISTILIILIFNRFKWRSTISGGIIASIFILSSPSTEFLNHALVRSLAIFIGAGVALVVNVTIAPPRYRQPLIQKLLEHNILIYTAFIGAVQSYLTLKLPSGEDLKKQTTDIEGGFSAVSNLFDRYRLDLEASPGKEEESIRESIFLRDCISYNKGLWQRTRDILFLAQERKQRRLEAGDLPISQEFQEILEFLGHALNIYEESSSELQKKLQGEKSHPLEEPHIWSKLDQILNHWHDRFPSGSYYLHALIEVSLITYKIRWAAKESSRLASLNTVENPVAITTE